MAFDLDGARKAGYSDDEIADFMSKELGFDAPAARDAGYSSKAIVGHLAETLKTRERAQVNAELDVPYRPVSRAVAPKQNAGAGRGMMAEQAGERAAYNAPKKPVATGVMAGYVDPGTPTPGVTESYAPTTPETRAAISNLYNAATPEKRAEIAAGQGFVAQQVTELEQRNALMDARKSPTLERIDPRAEKRASRMVGDGLDPEIANRMAPTQARMGVTPGQEIPGTIGDTKVDFSTRDAFSKTPVLSNPVVRGMAKGGLELVSGFAGVGEAMADLAFGEQKSGRQSSEWIRAKQEAIGEGTGGTARLESVISSLTQQLPYMVGGAWVARGAASAAYRSAITAGADEAAAMAAARAAAGNQGSIASLSGMAVTSFGSEYLNGKNKGLTPGESAARASLLAAFEVIGESFGLGNALRSIERAAGGISGIGALSEFLAANLYRTATREVPGELLTTTGQFLSDKLPGIGLNQQAGWDEYLKQMGETVIQTVMQGGIMAGGTTGVARAVAYLREGGRTPETPDPYAPQSLFSTPPATPPGSPSAARRPEQQTGNATGLQPVAPQVIQSPEAAAAGLAPIVIPGTPDQNGAVGALTSSAPMLAAIDKATTEVGPVQPGDTSTEREQIPAANVQVAPPQAPAGDPPAPTVTALPDSFPSKSAASIFIKQNGLQDTVAEKGDAGWMVRPAMRAETPEEAAKNDARAQSLNTTFERIGSTERVRAVRGDASEKSTVARVLGEVFGLPQVLVRGIKDNALYLDGVSYINAKISKTGQVIQAAVHEAFHWAAATHPDIAQGYLDAITPFRRAGVLAERAKFENENLKPGERQFPLSAGRGEDFSKVNSAEEEVGADVWGAMGLDPVLWQQMRAKDPSLFRAIRYRFLENVTRAINALSKRGVKVDTLITDRERVRELTSDAMAAVARRGDGRRTHLGVLPDGHSESSLDSASSEKPGRTDIGKPISATAIPNSATVAPPSATPAPAPKVKPKKRAKDAFLAFLGDHGVSSASQKSVTGEVGKKGNRMIQFAGPMFRKNGRALDELALLAVEAGFLTQADIDSDTDNGGVNKLTEMIRRAHAGEAVKTVTQLEREFEQSMVEFDEYDTADLDLTAPDYEDAMEGASDLQQARIEALTGRLVELLGEARAEQEIDRIVRETEGMSQEEYADELERTVEATARIQGIDAGGGDQGRQGSQETDPGAPEEFSLEGPTQEGLKSKAAQAESRRQEQARRDAAPPADDFTLTGSDRQADRAAAAGQMELGESDPRRSKKGEERVAQSKKVADPAFQARISRLARLTPEQQASTILAFMTGKAGRDAFIEQDIGQIPDVVQWLSERRAESGLPTLDISVDADREQLATMMAAEALAAIESAGNAVEWYDATIRKMLESMAVKYPELKSDPHARTAFLIAIAITSQTMNVEANLKFAASQYENRDANGMFPIRGSGKSLGAMEENFRLANTLLRVLGPDLLARFLVTEFTASELGAMGLPIDELGSESVLGSAVFGPKIGFGFFSNLTGNFEPTTMDMWFMRTVGRLAGTLASFEPGKFAGQVRRLRDALKERGSDGIYAPIFPASARQAARASDEGAVALARLVMSAHNRDYARNRAQFDSGARIKTNLVGASATIIKSMDKPKDAPQNGTERRLLRDVVKRMVTKVQSGHGKRIPPAALQALIWYPEQEFWKSLGVKLTVTSQDYAGAAVKFLEDAGYAPQTIAAAGRGSGSGGARQVAAGTGAGGNGQARPVSLRADALEGKDRADFIRARLTGNPGLVDKVRRTLDEQHPEEVGPRRSKRGKDQLSFDYELDPSQAGPAGEAAKRRAVDAVDSLRGTAGILALALSRDLAARQRTSLVGQTVAAPVDLAVLAQVYRDPRFETFRLFFVDGQDRVVSQVGLTQRLPGAVTAVIGDDAYEFASNLMDAARKKGATGFYMLHNHPSGKSVPSTADESMTASYAQKLMPTMKFHGHVVIDTNEFSVIDRNGQSQRHIRDFKQNKPLDPGDWAYWQIKGPNDAMNIAKAVEKDPNAVTLIMTDYQYQVHAVTTIPRSAISSNKQATFKAVARATLRNTGSWVFAVSHDETALLQIRTLVMDGVHITPTGGVKSLRETRPYGGSTPHHKASLRAPRLSPDTSEEFSYLRPVVKQGAPTSRSVPKGATGTLFEPGSEAFDNWFGDSKVVDADGKPMVVYHGTGQSFESFDAAQSKRKGRTDAPTFATFFSSRPEVASGYAKRVRSGANVVPAHVALQKPMEVDAAGANWHAIKSPVAGRVFSARYGQEISVSVGDVVDINTLVYLAKESGADGLIVRNVSDGATVKTSIVQVTVVAFSPTQIKSAIGNNGNYDRANPDIRRSKVDDLGFFSQLERAVEGAPIKAAPAEQWKAWLASNAAKMGVKAEEIQWSGVTDWLALQTGKVTKDAVVQYLANNGVQVTEAVRGDGSNEASWQLADKMEELGYRVEDDGGDDVFYFDPQGNSIGYEELPPELQRAVDQWGRDAIPPTQYQSYTLPGGQNYREMLLTLDQKREKKPLETISIDEALARVRNGLPVAFEDDMSTATIDRTISLTDPNSYYLEQINGGFGRLLAARVDIDGSLIGPDDGPSASRFESGHWKEPNVLAHIRYNERTDADGKRVLFIEEIQSDWAQAGRKIGFRSARPDTTGWTAEKQYDGTNGYSVWRVFKADGSAASNGVNAESAGQAIEAIADRWAGSGVPDAPFVRDTKAWVTLAVKRMIIEAARRGFDRVAFTTGEQNAERYDLSKQVGRVTYTPSMNGGTLLATDQSDRNFIVTETGVSPDKLADFIGKDAAQKLIDQPLKDGSHELRGNGLKVGGDGMKSFYNQIVPGVVRDVLKKVGGGSMKVVTLPAIPGSKGNGWGSTDENMIGDPERSQPGFDITPAMREKVAGGLPRFSKTGSKAPLERDELGRFRFAYGRRLEDTVKALLDPILTRLALKMASPELRKKLRAMKAEIARAQETAVEVAESMKAMPTDQAEMISDIIEQELVAGTVPPAELVTIATRIGAAMEAQTNELVRLGMISQEAADRWRGRYLPRFYESKLSKRVDPWMQAVMMAIRRPKSMQGIKGNNLKARGLPLETIDVADLPSWLADGWEIRDENYRAGTSDRVTVWRDYTREEREEMGEIRDARFRFVMGYMAAQKDIALGRLFEKIAADTADTGPHPGWVKVPSTKVEETGVNRFGKLSGMWVPKEVFDHLAKYDDTGANHELLLMYRKALGLWKESKTVLNPTAHANNVFGNVTMAHFAGVSYWDVHKYAGTVRDLVKDAPMVREARDAGLFLSTMGKDEIVQALPESLRLLADMQESSLEKGGRRVWNALALWLRKPMGAAYAGEDLFFRYMIYRDARSRGLEPGDAVNYAADFVFEYDDLPKGAMAIRDTFLPFFSWTYKAIPAMFTTATNYPWRFAAPAVAMYAVNAAMYAVAFGEKDDDWWQKIGRYVTDSDFRDKVRAEEKSERANLPPWLKGNSFTLGLPKAIRLGMDELTGLPVFMDISRMFPAGDLLDANSNTGGVPWLQSMTPSNPVLTTITAMFANRDMWTGRDLVDKNDTSKEAATKRAEWAWKQFTPAIAFGNYQLDRVLDTVARAAGTEIPGMFRDHTGVGRDKLPVQPLYTIENTFGIKARPYDLEQSRQIGESQKRELIRSLEYEIKRTQRYVNAGVMSFSQASKQIETDKAKIQNLKQGLTLEGAEKD